jgi:hypothetical protein
MNLGVQYYRPPFPDTKYWKDDFRRIKDAGLDTVQLWVLWGWVEAVPGPRHRYRQAPAVSGGNRLTLPASPWRFSVLVEA